MLSDLRRQGILSSHELVAEHSVVMDPAYVHITQQSLAEHRRLGAVLRAVHLAEYGAQAMAVHGGLLTADNAPPRQGYLASVRQVQFHVAYLDDLPADLQISAERLSGDATQVLYRFALSSGDTPVLDGRAAVILDAGALP